MSQTKQPATLRAAGRGAEPSRARGAVLGVLCAAAAIGAAELAAAFIGSDASAVLAVGDAAIDLSPHWLTSFAIRTFGSSDKPALLIGIGVTLLIVSAVVGAVAIRRPIAGVAGLLALGAAGLVAALTRPDATWVDALPTVIGTAAGLLVYRWLLPVSAGEPAAGEPLPGTPQPAQEGTAATPSPPAKPTATNRRSFLRAGILVGGAAAAAGIGGRALSRYRFDVSESRSSVRLGAPTDPGSPIPAGADLDVAGLSSFITPNGTFYRVDTALIPPHVTTDGWTLRIHGMVDRELTLDYQQLIGRPTIERDVTLCCVSNEVGGPYAGNARWVGVPLAPLLDEAGVHPEADQLVSRSADGFTAGSPTALVMDGRDAMLALSMNGEPLPVEHGFPVRMIVPGLYGYVSATKWLVDLELTTFDAFDPYWIERGWSRPKPIETMARIDTPRDGAGLHEGRVAVAGVAWAQHRGISAVEARVDQGAWMPARVAAEDSVDTWRQWLFEWDATPGEHVLEARATDGEGEVQTGQISPPFPDGATGWHAVRVRVG